MIVTFHSMSLLKIVCASVSKLQAICTVTFVTLFIPNKLQPDQTDH